MIGRYLGGLLEAWHVSGILGYLLVMSWLLFPVAVVTVHHPGDAVGFQLWLQGFAVPHTITTAARNEGALAALLFLGLLCLVQYHLVVHIYRRAQFYVRFYPLALFLVGGIANGLWWLKTGYFDPWGAMEGLSPVISALTCQGFCERLGADFVFGRGEKPRFEGNS
jgi:hypothetical protein